MTAIQCRRRSLVGSLVSLGMSGVAYLLPFSTSCLFIVLALMWLYEAWDWRDTARLAVRLEGLSRRHDALRAEQAHLRFSIWLGRRLE